MPFFVTPIKCMYTISVVQFAYYESMMRILCSKPSSFCANKPLLYSHNIVGILIKLIFFGGGVFLNNNNNVLFTWIICTRSMTIDNKVTDLILTSLQLGLIYISLCLQCHVFMLDGLNLIVTVLQIITEQCKCCIFFFNGLLMDLPFFLICKLKNFYLIVTACNGLLMFCLYFVCKLLSNLWEHHITTMLSEAFCFWLLT